MPNQYALMSAFNGGEWSSKLLGQVTLQKYRDACQCLENFLVYAHGPSFTRPGFKFIATLQNSANPGKLIPFIYSNQIAYMMIWEEELTWFIFNQSPLLDGSSNLVTVVTPYQTADLPYIQTAQSEDVQYVVHPNYPVYKMERLTSTSFSFPAVSFNDGPYREQNTDQTIFLQVSALSGTGVSLTAFYRGGLTNIGTWSDAAATAESGFTATLPSVGFLFKPTSGCNLNTVELTVVSAPTSTGNVTAYLYSDSSGSPGTLLDTSDVQDISAGSDDYTWTFPGTYQLDAATWYWVVFTIAVPDNTITLGAVTHNTSYGSGANTTAASISDNTAFSWKCQPTITPSGPADIFNTGHVGALWRLEHSGKTVKHDFSATGQKSSPILLRGKFQVDMTPDTPPSGGTYWIGTIVLQSSSDQIYWQDVATFFYSTTQSFVESRSDIYYRLYCRQYTSGSGIVGNISQSEQWGTVLITDYVSADEVLCTVLFPPASTDPTPNWREGAWSPYRGYPATVLFHDDRLWFAMGETLWASWVSDYENFNPDGDTDDAALTFSPTQLTNPITWIESLRGIMVGSIGQEGQISGGSGSNQTPITAKSVLCNIQTSHGSAQYPPPVSVGQAVLFLQAARRKIREFVYDLASDAFKAPDLCLRADHITVGGLFDMAYKQEPNSVIYTVRADGVMPAMIYQREEAVMAWARIITQGSFESVACKPSSTGILEGHTELWTIVNRTLNGQTVRCVEVMADNEATTSATQQASDFVLLDCCTVSGPGSATVTGLSYLENETVTAMADGLPVGTFTVTGGAITLPFAPTIGSVVGLPYTCVLGTLPLEQADRQGSSTGRQKQAYQLALRLLNSSGGKYGRSRTELYEIPYSGIEADTQMPLYSGVKLLDYTANERDMSLWIVQDQPLPLTVSAIVAAVSVED